MADIDPLARPGGDDPAARLTQIERELALIEKLDLPGYFLIVWDFVTYARSQGIPCGGRGSACSTVVGYALDNVFNPKLRKR
jgi:error-prone DNA polymerase